MASTLDLTLPHFEGGCRYFNMERSVARHPTTEAKYFALDDGEASPGSLDILDKNLILK